MRSLLLLKAPLSELPEAAEAALASGADGLIFDIKLIVPDLLDATCNILRAAAPRSNRPRLFARIPVLDNDKAISSLAAVIAAGADGIVLPEALGGHDVTRLDARISVEEAVQAIGQGEIKIIAEAGSTARATLGLPTFPGASRRLIGLIWSADRLAADLGNIAVLTPEGQLRAPLAAARVQVLISAYAAGVTAIVDASVRWQAVSTGLRFAADHLDGFAAGVTHEPDEIIALNALMSAPRR